MPPIRSTKAVKLHSILIHVYVFGFYVPKIIAWEVEEFHVFQ